MRITPQEQAAFVDVLSQYVTSGAELKLFGSRVDDNAKGEIKAKIGDQKIDLVITTLDKIQQSAFLQSIYPESQCLMQWR